MKSTSMTPVNEIPPAPVEAADAAALAGSGSGALIEARGLNWFLQGPTTTYALGVTAEGHLVNRHWGGRLKAVDTAAWRPRLARPMLVHPAGTGPEVSLETVLAEYPAAGGGDFRTPAIEVEHADGARVLNPLYAGHRIIRGKPALSGLPATYVEDDAEAETLEIELVDETGGVRVFLLYTVFAEHDAIARSVRIRNCGDTPIRLLRVLSASVDLPEEACARWLHLAGAWAREAGVVEAAIRPGLQSVESRRGVSSHQHNPAFALLGPDAAEEQGEVWGFSLVYSGNFLAAVEREPYGLTRAQIGLNPAGFTWRLEPGGELQSPEAVLVFSDAGVGAMSRTYHRLFRTRLARGPYRDAARPVQFNNWAVTYFDFTETQLIGLAGQARRIGAELFVLDDGWFGRRDNDQSSLGDWIAHARKLPNGVRGLAEAVNREGLAFGLWLEPEMVSPDSDLHRAHPDWCLHVPGRERSLFRAQLVLDFSREDVREAMYARVAALLASAPIAHVKWDMNRYFTEVGSAGREPGRQAETAHRYVLGVYAFLERLTRDFPRVLWENCSSGGGRFDPGMLHYMPQTWTSDNSDAISRVSIQLGTSLFYPPSTIGAHITGMIPHQIRRQTPLRTRGLVAMTGAFGLQLNLPRLEAGELAEVVELVALKKRLDPLLRTGDLYRLKDFRRDPDAAWMFAAPDASEVFVVHVRGLVEANGPLRRLRLRGLAPDRCYRDEFTGAIFPGEMLLRHGLIIAGNTDFEAQAWHLRAMPPGPA